MMCFKNNVYFIANSVFLEVEIGRQFSLILELFAFGTPLKLF